MSGNTWPPGLVIVDKPGGMTSHDVVARIRRLAHTRRVGHAGTLDPMATGVLVIGIEKATRLLGHLMLTEKTYEATIRLGRSTTTDDAEGEPTGGSPATEVTHEALAAEIAKLTGEIRQVPSSVSAIKVNGQRAYKLTRAGEAPELAARAVTIHEFRVTAVRRDGDFLDVAATIRCSSGTYIRALARDLGSSLATGGHLTALRRTAVGPYTIAKAHPLEAMENQSFAERLLVSPRDQPARPDTLGTGVSGAAETSDTGRRPGGPVATPAASRGAGCELAVPWVTPLAEAAASAFSRMDLTEEEARRLTQGARLPLPASWPRGPQGSSGSGPVAPEVTSSGLAAPRDNGDQALSATGPQGEAPAGDLGPREPAPGTPIAAFDPDGSLVALVTAEHGQIRSLAVFAEPAPSSPGGLPLQSHAVGAPRPYD